MAQCLSEGVALEAQEPFDQRTAVQGRDKGEEQWCEVFTAWEFMGHSTIGWTI